jgi:hypothetical protein
VRLNRSKENKAGGGERFRSHFQFHIPLAEQFRRRPAKPQRLVRFQHGIPFSGIGVERHTPVFQTGVEGALPSCPSISQVNPVCRQRPRTVEGAGARPPSRTPASVRLGFHFCDAKTGAGHDFTGLTAAVQLRLRVASGLQTLTVKSRLLTGEKCWRTARCANPRQPTISASVVKLLSSSASNGEFAGGSPAGCTNLRACGSTRIAEGPDSESGSLGGASLPTPTISGMSTGQACRACLLNSACLRASGASPRHSAMRA